MARTADLLTNGIGLRRRARGAAEMFSNASQPSFNGGIFVNHAPEIVPPSATPPRTAINRSSLSLVEHELYAQLLYPKRMGYPLWEPKPCDNMPLDYRKDGVCIGDLGILNERGGFDYLFNVCRTADDPVNLGRVPEGFTPISELKENDLGRTAEAYPPGSHVASSDNIAKDRLPLSREDVPLPNVPVEVGAGLVYQAASKGALLILPEGGSRTDLTNLAMFHSYATQHAREWYAYSSGVLGRDMADGSALYLVTGCDKARAWGVAAFSGAESQASLEFVPILRRDQGLPDYDFIRSEFASAKTGSDRLFGNHSGCVFLRGFKIALDCEKLLPSRARSSSQDWFMLLVAMFFSLLSAAYLKLMLRRVRTETPNANSPDSSGAETFATEETIIERFPRRHRAYHPLDVINQSILENNARVDVVATHDLDWCSIMRESEDTIPEDEELLRRVNETFKTEISGDGTARLTVRSKDSALSTDYYRWLHSLPSNESHVQINLLDSDPAQHPVRVTASKHHSPHNSCTTVPSVSEYRSLNSERSQNARACISCDEHETQCELSESLGQQFVCCHRCKVLQIHCSYEDMDRSIFEAARRFSQTETTMPGATADLWGNSHHDTPASALSIGSDPNNKLDSVSDSNPIRHTSTSNTTTSFSTNSTIPPSTSLFPSDEYGAQYEHDYEYGEDDYRGAPAGGVGDVYNGGSRNDGYREGGGAQHGHHHQLSAEEEAEQYHARRYQLWMDQYNDNNANQPQSTSQFAFTQPAHVAGVGSSANGQQAWQQQQQSSYYESSPWTYDDRSSANAHPFFVNHTLSLKPSHSQSHSRTEPSASSRPPPPLHTTSALSTSAGTVPPSTASPTHPSASASTTTTTTTTKRKRAAPRASKSSSPAITSGAAGSGSDGDDDSDYGEDGSTGFGGFGMGGEDEWSFQGGINVGTGGLTGDDGGQGQGGAGAMKGAGRLPGACTHCKKLKVKCTFQPNDNTCRRCKSCGHACIVEGSEPRTAPKNGGPTGGKLQTTEGSPQIQRQQNQTQSQQQRQRQASSMMRDANDSSSGSGSAALGSGDTSMSIVSNGGAGLSMNSFSGNSSTGDGNGGTGSVYAAASSAATSPFPPTSSSPFSSVPALSSSSSSPFAGTSSTPASSANIAGVGVTTSTPVYRPEATYAPGAGAIQFGSDGISASGFGMDGLTGMDGITGGNDINLGGMGAMMGVLDANGDGVGEEEMLATMQALKNPAWWQNMMMPGFSWPDSSSPSSGSSASTGSPAPAASENNRINPDSFVSQSGQKIHVNAHNDKPPFPCPFPGCGREFNVSANCRRHFRNHNIKGINLDEPMADSMVQTQPSTIAPSVSPVFGREDGRRRFGSRVESPQLQWNEDSMVQTQPSTIVPSSSPFFGGEDGRGCFDSRVESPQLQWNEVLPYA